MYTWGLKKGAIRHAPSTKSYIEYLPSPLPTEVLNLLWSRICLKEDGYLQYPCHNTEGCCFIVFPDLVRSVLMHIPLHRCLVTFGALWLFLTVLWVCLQSVIVVFPDQTHFLLTFFIFIHIFNKDSAKELDKGYLWGWGLLCNS